MRKSHIWTHSHAYVHVVPSTFLGKFNPLTVLLVLHLIGRCLAVAMRILG